MPKINSKQLTELGNSFLSFAQAIGDYRIDKGDTLSRSQHRQIKDCQWTLLNYADDLFTTSASLIMDDVQASVDAITDITGKINNTYRKLKNIQKAINVAAAGITLGAAIFSKSPAAIKDAFTGLKEAWEGDNG